MTEGTDKPSSDLTAAQPATAVQPVVPPAAPPLVASVLQAAPAKPTTPPRPAFLDAVSTAYSERSKGVVVLTGNTHDLFYCSKTGVEKYLDLSQSIYQEWKEKFHVVRLDIATGLSCWLPEDLAALQKVVAAFDSSLKPESTEKLGDIRTKFFQTRGDVVFALSLVRLLFDAVKNQIDAKPLEKIKPILLVVNFAGSMFPAGDFDRLNELDRQRLVNFLSIIESPDFKMSPHLAILVGDTRAEINRRVIGVPSAATYEIDLPSEDERRRFINFEVARAVSEGRGEVSFESNSEIFAVQTTGLRLTNLQDIMESSKRGKKKITTKQVIAVINDAIETLLGGVVKIKRPSHTFKDVIGYADTCDILRKVMARCNDPETAVSGVLVVGPNGAGKTFQMEAAAAESGRVVIELVGLRGSYFGETDAFFERFNMVVRIFGRICIFVDEAATAFGSVHKSDTHETEKRLAGNIIKLMGDPTMLSKIVWFMMTSRPDELDPDVKSRCPIQIPIFDLVGDDRKTYLVSMLQRKKLPVPSDEELAKVMEITKSYSNRDFEFLVAEVKAEAEQSVIKTLEDWQASCSIKLERKLQTLIAAQHCSYPKLLTDEMKEALTKPSYQTLIDEIKRQLGLF